MEELDALQTPDDEAVTNLIRRCDSVAGAKRDRRVVQELSRQSCR